MRKGTPEKKRLRLPAPVTSLNSSGRLSRGAVSSRRVFTILAYRSPTKAEIAEFSALLLRACGRFSATDR
jgi:hypothetical protein